MLAAIAKELENRKNYLNGETIDTVYIGGGTPSILTKEELELLLNVVSGNFNLNSKAEITLEANPDDLTKQKLKELSSLAINRLSIGVQSFNNEDLIWMNRAHNSTQVDDCLENAQQAGFSNISIDLIYGLPKLSILEWENNLSKAIEKKIQHISAYCLTVEPKTALSKLVKLGNVIAPPDAEIVDQFERMQNMLSSNGFEQYEVSSFCKPSLESRHNSNYWTGEKYLGVGPSAHSYNGESRQWNLSNNGGYIKKINANQPSFEIEKIENKTAYNEYILTRLRTKWGIDIKYIVTKFHLNITESFKKELDHYLLLNYIKTENEVILLTQKGMMMADRIASDLFLVD